MDKIKNKSGQIPKPIKMKKEKTEEDRTPQAMLYYIDDRLEMIKQIFGTLKPKTIMNLAPDFLKTKNLEDIEELCLHELLCISTKRLKSIIGGTKCPSDTESSDEDSDVQRQDDHISLEEISSDSELEGSSVKKAAKKKTVNGSSIDSTKPQKSSENDGEDVHISVLELLELQARARAIRSQLALEPITKIEVESEDDAEGRIESSKVSRKHGKNDNKNSSGEKKTKDSNKNEMTERIGVASKSSNDINNQNIVKKVKLKRNYRRSAQSEATSSSGEKSDAVNVIVNNIDKQKNDKEKDTVVKGKENDNGKEKEREKEKEKENEFDRSSSPDVIPIVAEPETLSILDSSDNEDGKNLSRKEIQEVDLIAKETDNTRKLDDKEKHSEPEEGEIEEDDSNENLTLNISISDKVDESDADNEGKEEKEEEKDVTQQNNSNSEIKEDTVNVENQEKNINESKSSENSENVNEEIVKTSSASPSSNCNNNNTNNNNNVMKPLAAATETQEVNGDDEDDDDQNDDVISLEGGDLESEMIEHLQNETNTSTTFTENKLNREEVPIEPVKVQQESTQLDDIISLDSSEDEHSKDADSWRSRYMRSSKVSKVLLASRLGKRVRDNITKSKRSKKEDSRHNSDNEKGKSTPVFSSRHEDGSVEQYKELLELRQRKKS